MICIGWTDREITTFKTWFISQIRFLKPSGIPGTLDGIDQIHTGMLILFIHYFIKNKEFRLRSNIAGIGNASFFQICLAFPGYKPWIAAIILSSNWVNDISYNTNSWFFKKTIHHSCIWIRNSQHI